MLSLQNIFDTIDMVDKQHLDIRTITMGISLLDCADEDMRRCCDKIYDKICSRAEKLVQTGCEIESEFGIPIVNKRISVTPMAIAGAACKSEDFVPLALTLDRAAKTCGVNLSAAIPRWCRRASPPVTGGCWHRFPRRWRRRSWCAPASTWAAQRPVSTWTPWRRWDASSRRRRT